MNRGHSTTAVPGPSPIGKRLGRDFAAALIRVVAALALVFAASLAHAAPAQAATYRDLKAPRNGLCVYLYSDPVESWYLERCSTTPAKYGNWTVTILGNYNNHALWKLQRQGGSCLGVGGVNSGGGGYLYASCSAKNSQNVWEVFPAGSGRIALKSFGAYQTYRKHLCLTVDRWPRLGVCNLNTNINHIFR